MPTCTHILKSGHMGKSQLMVSRGIKLLMPYFLSDWNSYLHKIRFDASVLAYNGQLIFPLQQNFI